MSSLTSRCKSGKPLVLLDACAHHVIPAFIVLVALGCHVAHNPVPLLTLVVLLSGAYGRAVWSELLRSRGGAQVVKGEMGSEGGDGI